LIVSHRKSGPPKFGELESSSGDDDDVFLSHESSEDLNYDPPPSTKNTAEFLPDGLVVGQVDTDNSSSSSEEEEEDEDDETD
jgi:hypothetical protein